MCGRFTVRCRKEDLLNRFDARDDLGASEWRPRYNAAPGQSIAALRQLPDQPTRTLSRLHWGLIPSWAKDAAIGYKMINARAETVAEKPSFRAPLRSRRCLIPADGFYEWQPSGREKLPWCFTMADNSLFAMAALWEEWLPPQSPPADNQPTLGQVICDQPIPVQPIQSCTILTTAPNELMRDVHDRMPVILSPDDYDLWLDPAFTRVDELQKLLIPYPAHAMRRFRVSPRVNQVKFDDPLCAEELPAA